MPRQFQKGEIQVIENLETKKGGCPMEREEGVINQWTDTFFFC